MTTRQHTLVVVVPCYNVSREIGDVIGSLPEWIAHVIAVDDCSTDTTRAVLAELAAAHPRLMVLHHDVNGGVGAAMVTGYREALRREADFVVKIDGDGQMDPTELPRLLLPLLEDRADYAKGNRFRHLKDLENMPRLRLFGNVCLTFMTKIASGYWHIFDAQNGYLAISRDALQSIPLARVDRSYAFENSMLALLNIESWAVIDVPMPAFYGDETSGMSLTRVMLSFPPRLLKMFLRRIVLKYAFLDVSPVAIYTIVGAALLAFACSFGGYHWWQSINTGAAAPTGTVVLALLSFLMGFTLLLQAINLDIMNSPRPRAPRERLSADLVPELFGGDVHD